MLPEQSNSEILLYKSDDGQIKIQVRFEKDTVWLNQTEHETFKSKSKNELSEVEKQFIANIEQANKKLKALEPKC